MCWPPPSFTTEFMAENISIHDPNTQEVKPTSVRFEGLFKSECSCAVEHHKDFPILGSVETYSIFGGLMLNRGGRYQVFSVRYDTEYFTFDTVDTILFSIPILNKSEASLQDKHVDNIHTHTDR